MFDSKISAAELVDELINEVDIAIPISNRQYIYWLNSLEQMLYSEIIKEQHKISVIEFASDDAIVLSELKTDEKQSPIRFEDIYTVYVSDAAKNRLQLTKTTLTSGNIFPNSYYKLNENMAYNVALHPVGMDIIYFIRPALKTADENDIIQNGNINVPLEFVDLIKAKLRAEAYKLANEDSIAAKWINDYNVLLETFKNWINNKAPQFGM